MTVIPTVFVMKEEDFQPRFDKLIPITKNIQIDFMDGEFVEGISPKIKSVPDLTKYSEHEFEAHLMYQRPKKFVQECLDKGFKKIIFHYESQENDHEVLYMWLYIKKNDVKPILALNPETPISVLDKMPFVDFVLFMGVHPGKEHQEFIPEVLNKIKELKEKKPNITIQVDGGVNLDTAKQLKEAGCDIINTGSFVSDSENPKDALKQLEKLFD